MNLTIERAKFIDDLRDAARMNKAVYDLLIAIDCGILIDGAGNKEIIASNEQLSIIEAAQLASIFAQMDRV